MFHLNPAVWEATRLQGGPFDRCLGLRDSQGRHVCAALQIGSAFDYMPPRESSDDDVGGAVWLGSGGQMMRPCSSNFIPRLRPILCRISLISLSDLRPKFLVFSISFSLF